MLTSLDHIQLAMPFGEEDAARTFFIRILGMLEEEKPEPLKSRGGVWFRAGSVVVHCGVETPLTPQKKAHPAFCVADLDTLSLRLTDAGYPVTWDDTLPDRRRFYTEDPFGNRIEFLQDGHGFAQR